MARRVLVETGGERINAGTRQSWSEETSAKRKRHISALREDGKIGGSLSRSTTVKWIHARQLEDWAETIDSETRLSELVSSLIRASVSERRYVRFPTGDSARLPGYDGTLIAQSTCPYVPDGNSVWEFGTEADYTAQGNRNFDKRSSKPGAFDPADTSFVFVSARTWGRSKPSIEEWQQEKTKQGPWKSVRFIDGVQLEGWLEESEAVAVRFATEVLEVMPPSGVRSTDQFWEEFSARFKPPLTEDVLLCGRAKQAAALLPQLMAPAGSYLLRADSHEEVLAFAVAAFRKADPDDRKYFESRTVIVDTQEAARSLMASENLTFLVLPAVGPVSGALSRRHPVLIPVAREDSRGDSADVLRPPTSHDMSDALQSMGLSQEQAIQLARKASRRITVLGRLIPSASAPRPAWAVDQELVPALLLGGWNANAEEDRQIVCTIAGTNSYEQYEERLRKYLKANDSPLESEGSVWHLVAPVDAFTHLAYLIGGEHVNRLQAACEIVFVEHDPALDLSAEENAYSGLFGKKLKHSNWLRDGLATTLLMFAALEEGTGLRIHNGAQHYVDTLVRALPGLQKDWRVMASLAGQLPLLMEAAPRPLLEALEQMLGGDGSGIRPIFRDSDAIFSSSPHTGLLWALETAAWEPEYLARTSLILARLARIDPGGKLSNRPIESLREIFLPWLPNTNAPLAQRLSALDYIIANEPEIGWRLILKLLPEHHSIGTHTAMPRFREAGASEKETVTHRLVWEAYSQIIDRALEMADDDPDRWETIIRGLPTFSPTHRERAYRILEDFAGRAKESQQAKLWTALRDIVNTHRAFQDAAWAMKGPELERLESVVQRLEPADLFAKVRWLFDDYHPRLPIQDSTKSLEEIEKARVDAVRQLYAVGQNDSVMDLATTVKLPRFVAFPAVEVIGDFAAIQALIDRSFQVGERLDEFVTALSSAAIRKNQQGWMNLVSENVTTQHWTSDQAAVLLVWWNDDPKTWVFVTSLGPEVERRYWQRKPAWSLRGDTATIEMAARKYLDAERALSALNALHTGVETVAPELLFEALDKAIPELASSRANIGTMTAYELERIFAALRQRPEVDPIEIAKREYAYLPLLEHGREALTLHGIMATDPAFFVSVLCDVFKPATGDVPEPNEERRRRARAGYQLLSGMEVVPGADGEKIDAAALNKWTDAVRELAAKEDRVKIADEYIGHILAHATGNADGTWPHQAICELLERLKSDGVELGILIERHNMRGAFSKAMYEGGNQERGLAVQAADWAKAALKWPRAHAMLLQISRSWNEDAKREDERARLDEMRFEQ